MNFFTIPKRTPSDVVVNKMHRAICLEQESLDVHFCHKVNPIRSNEKYWLQDIINRTLNLNKLWASRGWGHKATNFELYDRDL